MKVVYIPKYERFDDFFQWMLPTGGFWDNPFQLGTTLFRGESSAKFQLIPSALRKDAFIGGKLANREPLSEPERVRMEHYALWDFYKLANESGLKVKASVEMQNSYLTTMSPLGSKNEPFKWLSKEDEELTALAQHYGIKTRMLDWSSDLYTSLYFASMGALKSWKKSKLSKWKDENYTYKYDPEDYYDEKDSIVIYILNGGMIHQMTRELPLKLVVPSYYDNPNLKAQKGVLSYWQIDMPARNEEGYNPDTYPLDKRSLTEQLEEHDLGYDSDHINILYRIEIDINECGWIYSVVSKMGYHAASLFPGYDGVTQKLEEDDLHLEFCQWLRNKSNRKFKKSTERYNNVKSELSKTEPITVDNIFKHYEVPSLNINILPCVEELLSSLPLEDKTTLISNIAILPNLGGIMLGEDDGYLTKIDKWSIMYDLSTDILTIYDIFEEVEDEA